MKTAAQLLAGPKLLGGDGWTVPPVTRPLLLLSYLAFQEDWVSRDEILAVFWPDMRETKARQSLRALLYSCKKEVYADALEVEPGRVRWAVNTDVHAFQEAVSNGDWQGAVNLYEGTFLERVQGDASPAFEVWLEQTRDALHSSWRDAALQFASRLDEHGRASDAAELLQNVLAYDFLDEDVVQACMRAQARAGHKGRALSTFETFHQRLAEELEMKPLEATVNLAEAVRKSELSVQPQATTQTAPLTTSSTTPQPLTPFVGRTLELLELRTLLAQAQIRLITLLGPGGIGKSRLSLQLLDAHRKDFEDGAAFVALAGLSSAADIPSALASALNLDLSGERSVADEVCAYLQAKTMLVVLDNFEHVLEGVAFVAQLLTAAPSCTFICTSRVLLGLPNEIVYDLAGLSVPVSAQESDIEAYDAAQLFIRSARRVRSDFSISKSDHTNLFKLCQLLDGMPLALELAASWVRLFGLADLVNALEQDADLLEATGHEVSERHQSLRKVFEQSWQLLNGEEQRVLSALSVFYGSFDRAAANAVAQASAKTLLSLINKSLLRSTPAGRFSVLLVLRQYAAEKLADATYQERHGIHYLEIVNGAGEALKGPAPTEALALLERDLENIRAAWQWAYQMERFGLCEQVLEPLRLFFTSKALMQEGINFFNSALERLGTKTEQRFGAQLHFELAYFYRRLDQFGAAREHAEAALSLAQGLENMDSLSVNALCELSITHCWTGDFEASTGYAERALALSETLQNTDLTMTCKSRLALAKRYQGAFDEALQLYNEVLSYERQLARPVTLLRALSDMGRLLVDMKQPRKARVLFNEGLELATRHDLPYELGFMWEGLSQCSYLLGEFEQARRQAETALRCSDAVHDQMGTAIQSADLAKILLKQNRAESAKTYLKRALRIAWNKGELPEVLKHFVTWAELVKAQDPGRAATLLNWVVEHPSAQAVSKQQALDALTSLNVSPAEPPADSLSSTVNSLLRTPLQP